MYSPIKAGLTLACLSCPLFLLPAAHAQVMAGTYSGNAFDIFVNAPVLGPVTVNMVGPLPPAGGSLSNTVLSINVPGFVTTGVASASTMGGGNAANSSATVNDLSALPGDPAALTATVVTANSGATPTTAFGSSTITGLTFGGVPVIVTGAPNQTITLPGVATLVINEQINSSVGNHQEFTTNALDLTTLAGVQVIVSHANSDINAVPEPGALTILAGLSVVGAGFVLRRRMRRK